MLREDDEVIEHFNCILLLPFPIDLETTLRGKVFARNGEHTILTCKFSLHCDKKDGNFFHGYGIENARKLETYPLLYPKYMSFQHWSPNSTYSVSMGHNNLKVIFV